LGLAASHVQKFTYVLGTNWQDHPNFWKTIPVGNVTEAKLARVVEVVNGFESAG